MLFLILLMGLTFTSALKETSIDNGNTSCETSCDKTYPLHTYPTVENLDGCKRGCRLSTLIHLVHDNADVSSIKDLCIIACNEAYNQSYEQYACNVGCNNQELPLTRHSERNRTSIEIVFQSIFERVSGMASSNWILYIVEDQDRKNFIVPKSVDTSSEGKLVRKAEFSNSWWGFSNSESSEWFPDSNMTMSCFYDFLHFLFFKIIVLFLIFLFILTALTLLHITLYDFKKNQQGYISFIESAHYSINHKHAYSKLEV